ncbi:thiol reductant ABC exporter subunit CydD [Agromyces badenianii]|uniref:thiol reductant ABC exporter subunit CydD n=1 Tax=Agromyces badenianii TaxID=2080742 RepID=UPI000D591C95|nr:thiol reductant ABC exporter subunit CydD [Agromyces badenianii]PWC04374.1 thiol reductant ABC exporter subunit CydD [Agromyces badenianii]
MKPLDPRLVRRSRAARRFLLAGGALAFVQALAIIAFAWALATLVAGIIDGMAWPEAKLPLIVLAAAVSVRALAAWLWEWTGSAGAMRVKGELRAELLAAIERRPGGLPGFPTARIATLLGPGLDALDEYFGRYLPQLVLTVVATPLLIAATWLSDWLSGLILVIVLPLIPVFMALIGMATEVVQRRQWSSLQSLSRGFLEVVGGLSTLMLYGRAERQTGRIRQVTDDYRVHTMKVLRVTFLSGFTLELAASLSVALVAVSIGLRLVAGDMTLAAGLLVLVLAPEVFLPLRNVGAAFHASAEGVEASRDAFDLFEAADDPVSEQQTRRGSSAPSAAGAGLQVRGFGVRLDDREIVRELDFDAGPGEILALAGESGAGKSSVLRALLGFVPASGDVTLGGAPFDAAARPSDRAEVAWAGQSPTLLAGTIAANVRLGDEHAGPAVLTEALRLGGVDLAAELELGAGGSGLSGGQAQRVATARAIHRLLARDASLLLLDEPSSALDERREAELVGHLSELAAQGRTIVVATHRPALLDAADRVVTLTAVAHV